MDRRDFVRLGLAAGAAGASVHAAGAGTASILDAGVMEQQARMAAGKLSSKALVSQYLKRIAAVDQAGPKIKSIIELNPDALAIAADMDRERAAGKVRGPLHGIPVLLKDNIATGDKMCTTAGSLALDGVRATRDAFVAAQLRMAGAVILGKTNLSEWANMRSTRSTGGWSARGGLTKNPYALDRGCAGSSSGSGAAMAANLASLAVGTETDGSIVAPASVCGVVGIKPTVGLISRSGIIPIAASFDTAGPMARSVSDAAVLLTALAGIDPLDDVTKYSSGRASDYTKALDKNGLQGMRIGVARNHFGNHDALDAIAEKALLVLQAQGATLVDMSIPNLDKLGASEYYVMLYEFKAGLAAWLADYAPHAPIKNMADLIAFNEQHRDREMAHYGQKHLVRAQTKGGLDSKEYLDALLNNQKYAREEGIDKVMREKSLDCVVAPTRVPGGLSDLTNGDGPSATASTSCAVAGYPHITVPAGQVDGLPVGLSFMGSAWSEAALIRMAYAYEQASMARKAPTYQPTVKRSKA
jgi:amidase